MIEIFVNEQVALTAVVFPVLKDSIHVSIVGEGVAALDVWRLASTDPVLDPQVEPTALA